MTFKEFQMKWENMPQQHNGFLSLPIQHPLDLQIGYDFRGVKSLAVMNSGKVLGVPSSKAISTENPKLLDGSRIIEFKLIDASFEETYLRLCWDIIDYSSEGEEPLQKLLHRYVTWQKLLQAKPLELLSFEKQKGLLGELIYLNELMENEKEENAITVWTGPDGSDQDFVFKDTWTEVKAVSLAAESIRISSLEQLNQERDGKLRIYFLEKTTAGVGRVSLVQQVNNIRKKLKASPNSLDRFEMKLFKYGYRSKDEEKYEENQFRLVEYRDYTVNEYFPKMTVKNVPVAVTECKYRLSIAAIDDFREK